MIEENKKPLGTCPTCGHPGEVVSYLHGGEIALFECPQCDECWYEAEKDWFIVEASGRLEVEEQPASPHLIFNTKYIKIIVKEKQKEQKL